jgi:EmrB/QacA subfamily drug resistance transporter
MTNPASEANDDGRSGPDNRRWWALVAICGATFMLLVDVTIVQVALPSIQRSLHSSFTNLQWVVSAYALTLSALVLTSGSLADRFGRKRIFVAGLAVFTLSSLLCGVSNSSLFLNLARALQGFGGAAMFATSLALIGQEFQGMERAKAIGAWGATVGGAVALGPLVGGALTSGLGWRWIFFVNLPIGVVTFVISIRQLVNVSDPEAKRVDVGGLILFSGALFCLNLGLLRGNADGWASSLILSLFGAAALLFVGFVLVELRQTRPMFDMSLFRNPGFCGVSIATFAIGGGMFALFTYLTLYLQNDLGASPLGGGLRLLPCTLLCFIVPPSTRTLTEKIPAGLVLGTGMAITALGIALMSGLTASSAWTTLLPGLILTGLGIGLANPSIAKIGLGVVHPARTGMASGISNTMRISGLATGIAGLGAIFQGRVSSEIHSLVPGAPASLAGAVTSGGTRGAASVLAGHPALSLPINLVVHRSFASGMNEIFFVGAAVVAFGALCAFTLVRARSFFKFPAAGDVVPNGQSVELGGVHQLPDGPSLAPDALGSPSGH